MTSEHDISILRGLAHQYLDIANNNHNNERRILHRAINDLKMVRPIVILGEIPWKEVNINDELTCKCTDPDFLRIETYMRQVIYQFKYIRGDMIVRPYIPIEKVIYRAGIGIVTKEETLQNNADSNVVSHEYIDQFEDCTGLEKLHYDQITYDEEETNRQFFKIANVIGDILAIKKVGINHPSLVPWDVIAQFRGMTPLLIDLIAEPEFSHALMRKVTDIIVDRNDQFRRLGLFDSDPNDLQFTSNLCSDLHPELDNTDNKNLWGRAAAQPFASVSKEMHDEFEVAYIQEALKEHKVVYYGCCEPLDQKIEILEKMHNLRKISISPWANINVAAEAAGHKYVLACKPNPALVAVGALDKNEVKKEICSIMDACYKNNCNFELILKDISTANHRAQNLIEWEKTVMDIVTHY